MTPPRFVTDLNGRERQRYAEQLRTMAAFATKAADALLAEDDQEAMVNVVILGLSSTFKTNLLRVFLGAAEAAKLAADLDHGDLP